MKMQLRLLASCAALALAGLAFTGCGNDCAEGTTETDGECKVDTKACGAGTKLENGACVLDTSGCGEGSSLKDGVCVADDPTGEECGDGTMFDSGTGKCVPNEVIECGANTMKVDGKCVPAGTVCTDGTMLNADGQCVVAAPACATGTQLDPNTAKCVVTDQVCDTNTSFDAQSGTCKPSATVCATGTTFSTDTGLCLPDATCQMGDVIVDGQCYSPAEALYQATQTEGTENDDINLGGTANDVALPAMGMKTAIKGVIGLPVDLDNDGELDQDVDVYKVTATAGQHIGVTLQAIGGPSMSFAVFGPNDYNRFAPLGVKRGAARTVVAPVDGDYYIAVAPALVIANDDAGPIGEDTWRYVAEVELLPAPTVTDVNTDNANISGSYGDLSDNLYKLTNFTGGELVDVTVKKSGDNAQGVLQVWSSATSYLASYPVGDVDDTFTVVLPAGDAFLFVDWVNANGPALDYEFEVKAKPGQEGLGALMPGGTASSTAQTLVDNDVRFFTVTIAPGEVLEFSQTNDAGEEVDITVNDIDGQVFRRTFFDVEADSSPDFGYIYSATGGTYIIEVEATADMDNFVLNVNSLTPAAGGSFAVGDNLNITDATPLGEERQAFQSVVITADVAFSGSLLGGGGETIGDLSIFNAANGDLVDSFTSSTVDGVLPAGTYIFAIEANFAELPTGYVLDLDFTEPPIIEVEPNDTPATATPAALDKNILGNFATGDLDIYSFTMAADQPADETAVVHVNPNGSTSGNTNQYTCTVKDSMGTEVATQTSNTDCVLFLQGLTTGDYTLEVSTTRTTSESYEIAVDTYTGYVLETGMSTDMMPDTLMSEFKVFGQVQTPTEADYYTFVAPQLMQGQTFSLVFDLKEANTAAGSLNKDSTTSVRLELFDSMGTSLGSVNAPFGSLAPTLVGGDTYTLAVTRASTVNFTGRYSIETVIRTPPPTPVPYFNDMLGLAIPDNAPATPVSDVLNVPDMCIITDIIVEVDIDHTFRGDLELDLTSPTGTKIKIWADTGGGSDDLKTIIGLNDPPTNPLDGFFGEQAMGNWTLEVGDDAGGDTGTLNKWGLSFNCQ